MTGVQSMFLRKLVYYACRVPGGRGRKHGKGGWNPNGPEVPASYMKYRLRIEPYRPYPYPNSPSSHELAYMERFGRAEEDKKQWRHAANVFHRTCERILPDRKGPHHMVNNPL